MADIIGKGTAIAYSPDGSTYTTIARVRNSKPPAPKAADVEMTAYEDDIEVFSPGWVNAGEAELKLSFAKALAATLYGFLALSKYWKITLPDGSTITWQGYINEWGTEVPLKTSIENTFKIKATSLYAFTAGS